MSQKRKGTIRQHKAKESLLSGNEEASSINKASSPSFIIYFCFKQCVATTLKLESNKGTNKPVKKLKNAMNKQATTSLISMCCALD